VTEPLIDAIREEAVEAHREIPNHIGAGLSLYMRVRMLSKQYHESKSASDALQAALDLESKQHAETRALLFEYAQENSTLKRKLRDLFHDYGALRRQKEVVRVEVAS